MSHELTYPDGQDLAALQAKTKMVRVLMMRRLTELSDEDLFAFIDDGRDVPEELHPPDELLAEIVDKQELGELFACLAIKQREGGWTCPVVCDLCLEFWPSRERISISESIIRWESKWLGDGELEDWERLSKFLAARIGSAPKPL